jgi:hypothetical protein
VPTPPEYTVIDRARPGIVAEYPLGQSDIYRLWQRAYGRPLLNGAPPESPADYARLALLDPAEPGTAEALSLLGVTVASIHPQAQADVEIPPHEPTNVAGYRLLGRFADRDSIWYPGGASVWEVTAPPAPALVTLPGGFAKPISSAAGFARYPLTSPSGVGVLDFLAKKPGVVRLVFDAFPAKSASHELRLADSSTEKLFNVDGRTTISVLVAIPKGESRLLLKTDPAATSLDDALQLSTPRARRATGEPELHADLVSADPGF